MSLCREVVTLQLGHYSNFVGTHWWNLQDASLCYDPDMPPGELQSDVLFREGLTRGGHVTYTPRLITLDLKGSLRTLKQEGSLYSTGQEPSTITWEGQIMTHKESPPAKNSFLQDLDKLDKGGLLVEPDFNTPSVPATHSPGGMVAMDTVNSNLERVHKFYKMEGSVMVWSDFLRLHLHPRTVSVINQYNHEGEAARLEAFSQGETLLQGSVLEDLEDRLHFFVEECDYLQGFQVLCDLADGFSGLGSKVTELLQDSYGGRGILTWGVAPVNHPDSSPIKELYHMMNFALGTVNLANHSSFFCPLTLRGSLGRRPSPSTVFPLVNYDSSLWYHSSSILALALDSMTVSYRLRYNSAPMWQLADALTVSGRKVVCAYGSVPFPIMQGTCLPDALSACGDVLPWKPLSACPELADGRCFGQSVTLKGLDRQRLVSPLAPGIQPSSTLHCARTGEEVLDTYIRSHYPSAPLVVQLVSTPSKLTPPFPQMFSSLLDPQGLIQRHPPTTAGPAAVLAAPVLTSVQSSSAVGQMLAELQKACVSVEMRRSAPSFLCQGLEAGDLAENLEQLRVLAYHYRDDSGGTLRSSSEEEDDDDVD
ncbi:protein misato homolog 1 isoform X2 [Electrophorus electricus]|uniref:protein misato homolog 1 isoform X2 n=1 Tax=Electrophorus electricus TaxID=8005 RepID=UPI000F0A782B|nr:protein misato homolog 1 isoform X2 [Electrophorus electricus]